MAGVEDVRVQRAGLSDQIREVRRLQQLSGADPEVRREQVSRVAQRFGWGAVDADVDALLARKLKEFRSSADGFGPARKTQTLLELPAQRGALPPRGHAGLWGVRPETLGAVSLQDFALEATPRGLGAAGAVYFGTHTASGLPVAIKEMTNAGEAAMEIEALQALPNGAAHVPTLLAHFVENGKTYIAMSRGGTPLGTSVEPMHAAVTESLGVLEGLAHLHEAGFVHRDIKPDNVLRVDGDPSSAMLIDFSNAARIDTPSGASAPAHGGVAGFIPPEQLTGKPGHPLSGDVFSAATVLVARLTGESPFYSDHPVGSAEAWDVIYRKGPRLDGIVDPSLAGVLRKALSYEPEARYQSAPEFSAALRPFLTRPEPSVASVVRRFPEGTLVKEASSPTLYILFGGAKFPAMSPAFFEATDRQGQRIRTVPDGALDSFGSIPANGTWVKESGSPDVYRIEAGKKRPISAEEMLRLSWDDVRMLPEGSLQQIAGNRLGPASGGAGNYRILNAQYATAGHQTDVTEQLNGRLAWDTRVRADNDSMGGDPEVGARKSLRMIAADASGQAKVFAYGEGSDVDGRLFRRFVTDGTVRLSAQYGTAEHHVDVTERVLELAHAGGSFEASNGALGIDPHPGVRKSLRLYFLDRDGLEHAVELGEGSAVPFAELASHQK